MADIHGASGAALDTAKIDLRDDHVVEAPALQPRVVALRRMGEGG